MSLNKPRTQLPNKGTPQPLSKTPNYADLVQFLIQPFLESPEALKVDCEVLQNNSKVWIRLAIDTHDKGRVYGRGGRNIQAIKTVLEAAAKAASQSIYLDVYEGLGGTHAHDSHDHDDPHGYAPSGHSEPKVPPSKPFPRRPPSPRPSHSSRSR